MKLKYPGIEELLDGRKRIRLRAVDPRTGRMKEVDKITTGTIQQAVKLREQWRDEIRDADRVVKEVPRLGAYAESWIASKALALKPDFAEMRARLAGAYHGMASCLKDAGELAPALECYRKAERLDTARIADAPASQRAQIDLSFDLVEAGSLEDVWAQVGTPKRAAYLGNETGRAEAAGLAVNPSSLTAYLDWGRSYKTPYEIHCIEQATILGARGHEAGRKAFLAGASELEIHYAFMQSVGCLEFELAFASIVAQNEKGATLHYENKRSFRRRDIGCAIKDPGRQPFPELLRLF